MDVVLTFTTFSIATTRLIFKRFYFRSRRLGPDDWLILIAMVLGAPALALSIFGIGWHGLGKDIWGIPPESIVIYVRYFYIIEMLYIVLISLAKLTLCLFYISIFSVGRVLYVLWGTAIFHVLCAVAFVVKLGLQCSPLSFYWEQLNFLQPATGHCIDINSSTWTNAAITVASDVWLLAIPLSQVSTMRLHWKKKVAASIMFATGAM